jgi:hypothetical protein
VFRGPSTLVRNLKTILGSKAREKFNDAQFVRPVEAAAFAADLACHGQKTCQRHRICRNLPDEMSVGNTTGWARNGSNAGALASARGATPVSCPACGSDNTQRLSVIHMSGISQFSAVTNGVAWGRRAASFGHAWTKGVSQTELSTLVAPPPKKTYRSGLLLLFLSPPLAAVAAEALLLLVQHVFGVTPRYDQLATACFVGFEAGAAVLLLRALKFNKDLWPKLLLEWQMSFMCSRCGQIFVAAVPQQALRKL